MDLQLLLKTMNTLGKMRKHERWTRDQLEVYQAKKLLRLREFAYAHSPFYQRFHKGLFDRPLAELPVLTKATVMENFDQLVTDRDIKLKDVRAHMANDREGNRFLNRYWVTATSGSTGTPGVFLFNRDEWSVVIANSARMHEWAGAPTTRRMRMASVASVNSGSPWHLSAQAAATVRSGLMNAWAPTLPLDAAQPLSKIVQQLNAWRPYFLAFWLATPR